MDCGHSTLEKSLGKRLGKGRWLTNTYTIDPVIEVKIEEFFRDAGYDDPLVDKMHYLDRDLYDSSKYHSLLQEHEHNPLRRRYGFLKTGKLKFQNEQVEKDFLTLKKVFRD